MFVHTYPVLPTKQHYEVPEQPSRIPVQKVGVTWTLHCFVLGEFYHIHLMRLLPLRTEQKEEGWVSWCHTNQKYIKCKLIQRHYNPWRNGIMYGIVWYHLNFLLVGKDTLDDFFFSPPYQESFIKKTKTSNHLIHLTSIACASKAKPGLCNNWTCRLLLAPIFQGEWLKLFRLNKTKKTWDLLNKRSREGP